MSGEGGDVNRVRDCQAGDWPDDEMVDLRRRGVDLLVSCLTPSEELELDLTSETRSG
jgi:hypothetical protein